MAIPCNMCGNPVHEQSVKCPHCGEATGVPVDPLARATIETMRKIPEIDGQPASTGFEKIEEAA